MSAELSLPPQLSQGGIASPREGFPGPLHLGCWNKVLESNSSQAETVSLCSFEMSVTEVYKRNFQKLGRKLWPTLVVRPSVHSPFLLRPWVSHPLPCHRALPATSWTIQRIESPREQPSNHGFQRLMYTCDSSSSCRVPCGGLPHWGLSQMLAWSQHWWAASAQGPLPDVSLLQSPSLILLISFLRFFFLIGTIHKLCVEFVTSFLFYGLVLWPQVMWDLSSTWIRDRTHTPCIGRRSLNHWSLR